MGQEENSKELENLCGPWMNVPPQRRPKNMSKGMGNQGSGSMNQGSRFDALRKVSEDFGFDNVDSGGMVARGTARKFFVYKKGVDFEKKIWTKTRQTNVGNMVMLGDISNKHGKSKAS
ncbi:PREDICTED: LOC110765193 isoform X2 [Prunus dulcis]|uniref:PREDICTED: LOC110765193 isoform X2 n=1 Tax=Prunus dulcis TaxID=3755 RepID=A0A5E4FE19_PRUDU|nr:PREDICTED: LOC110765193 isoform X2 [Prunus dulcis]